MWWQQSGCSAKLITMGGDGDRAGGTRRGSSGDINGSSSKKRRREQRQEQHGDVGGGDNGSSDTKRAKATVGQQTSHIRNKLVRAELYAKLKHKKKKDKKTERKKRDAEAAKAESLGLQAPPRQAQKVRYLVWQSMCFAPSQRTTRVSCCLQWLIRFQVSATLCSGGVCLCSSQLCSAMPLRLAHLTLCRADTGKHT